MNERRVAVTGIGLVSALGIGRDGVWEALVGGQCGMRRVTLFDVSAFRAQCAAEIPTCDAFPQLSNAERRRWSRSDVFAVTAASEALLDSQLAGAADPTRIGVWLRAGTGDLFRNERYFFDYLDKGPGGVRPSQIHRHSSSTTTDLLAERFELLGPRASIVAACSSSAIAIGHAGDAVRFGEVDAAVCGGADALCRLTFSGFNALRLMDPEPCRPFEASRAGMNIGEGAGILVLEDFDRARRRGAEIYAELAGFGFGCEAYHPTAPEPEGVAIAATLSAALDAARVAPADIGHVNAHGTATTQNDIAEARALQRILGHRTRQVPVNSIKSMVGHCLGAAGAIEAAATVLSIFHGVIPPTVHHQRTDPACDLDIVANDAREARVTWALSTSLAFGGNDSALVFRRV